MQWQPRTPLEMKRFTPQQKELMRAEQAAVLHTAELERIRKVEHTAYDEEFHARSAVDALTTLGRFDEASEIAHLAPPEYAERLVAHEQACLTDDADRCECENPTTPKTEGGNVGMAVSFGTDENPRYLVDRPAIYNPYAKRIDTVYRCHQCGHVNSLPSPPDKLTADHHDAVARAHQAHR